MPFVPLEADFLYLLREGGFSQVNLSGQLQKLEDAGYVEITKRFKSKLPLTVCSLTPNGRSALTEYARRMVEILAPLAKVNLAPELQMPAP